MRTSGAPARVALVTYSTRARGGVVHTLYLAEALHRASYPAHLFALGDPAQGFFRPVEAPHTIVAAPPSADSLEERVVRAADSLAAGLADRLAGFDIVHAQDCIAARAALDLRARGREGPILRTVHHVDDFTTPMLIECQRRSIVEPDAVAAVSEHWRGILRREFGVDPFVVTSGVHMERFRRPAGFDAARFRARVGAASRPLFLTVGGIEPRKGSLELIEALGKARGYLPTRPVLAVVGGHSFQDYAGYRETVFRRASELELEVGRDLLLPGTVPDEELPSWYQAADAFVFPSVKEGWGLVVLEALSAGLPVVATDIPVFREYLRPGQDALLVPPGDPAALARAMAAVHRDRDLRRRLVEAGLGVAARFTWEACAAKHVEIYGAVAARRAAGARPS